MKEGMEVEMEGEMKREGEVKGEVQLKVKMERDNRTRIEEDYNSQKETIKRCGKRDK